MSSASSHGRECHRLIRAPKALPHTDHTEPRHRQHRFARSWVVVRRRIIVRLARDTPATPPPAVLHVAALVAREPAAFARRSRGVDCCDGAKRRVRRRRARRASCSAGAAADRAGRAAGGACAAGRGAGSAGASRDGAARVRRPDPRARAPQLELEGRTRAELEDVLQRIERHFRSEQAVRRRAEESEREAAGELARERELRVRLEEEVRGVAQRRAARAGRLSQRGSGNGADSRVASAAPPALRGDEGDGCAARVARGRARCRRGGREACGAGAVCSAKRGAWATGTRTRLPLTPVTARAGQESASGACKD